MNQIRQGIRTELEHKGLAKWVVAYDKKHHHPPSDAIVASKIASAHLREDKHYYSKLRKVERR